MALLLRALAITARRRAVSASTTTMKKGRSEPSLAT